MPTIEATPYALATEIAIDSATTQAVLATAYVELTALAGTVETLKTRQPQATPVPMNRNQDHIEILVPNTSQFFWWESLALTVTINLPNERPVWLLLVSENEVPSVHSKKELFYNNVNQSRTEWKAYPWTTGNYLLYVFEDNGFSQVNLERPYLYKSEVFQINVLEHMGPQGLSLEIQDQVIHWWDGFEVVAVIHQESRQGLFWVVVPDAVTPTSEMNWPRVYTVEKDWEASFNWAWSNDHALKESGAYVVHIYADTNGNEKWDDNGPPVYISDAFYLTISD